MSLKEIGTSITSQLGRQILTVQKHSPVLLFGVGVAGFVGTVFFATKATLNLGDILEEAEANLEVAKNAEDEKKATTKVYVASAIKVARLYAPSVAIGVGTIFALTSSHIILTKRNAAIGAAYATVQKAFNEYRAAVVEELGEDKDREFKHGTVVREVAVDTDDGVAVKTITHFDSSKVTGWDRIFDEFNTLWERSPERNYQFLKCQEVYLNNRLHAKGHIFMNDVYTALGLDAVPEGQLVGWLVNKPGYDKGDGFIDFGLDNLAARDFVNGYEASVLLSFNPDGIIYDLI